MVRAQHGRPGIVQVGGHHAGRPIRCTGPRRGHDLPVMRQAAGQRRRSVVPQVEVDHGGVGDGQQRGGERRDWPPVRSAARGTAGSARRSRREPLPGRGFPAPACGWQDRRVRPAAVSVSRGTARLTAYGSRRSRTSKICARSSGVHWITLAPRFGMISTRPSAASRGRASRIGVRLTCSRLASSASPNLVPDSNSPLRIRSRSTEAAFSAACGT